jgi:glycerol-3-phosphate cytidylyltransferase
MKSLAKGNSMLTTGTTTPAAHFTLPRVLNTRPTRAITYGTYDIFHVGHVNLFRRIKERFDHLVVAVSTDEFNAIKGKKAVMSFSDRCAMVGACRYVDQVIAECGWEQKVRDIVAHRIDAFVMGSDWEGRFDELKSHCEVVYLARTEGISSTQLKQEIQAVRPAVQGEAR